MNSFFSTSSSSNDSQYCVVAAFTTNYNHGILLKPFTRMSSSSTPLLVPTTFTSTTFTSPYSSSLYATRRTKSTSTTNNNNNYDNDEAGSYDPQNKVSELTESEQYDAANTLLQLADEQKKSTIELPSEIQHSFMQYALSIILGRALPDARDGLKPVHRRILYAMHMLSLSPGSGYRKCARVVGEVLGKFHPHGDTAVYDALVRLAQDFVTGTVLIDGHGNFGSIDNDPAAAMRYTECRLTKVASEALLDEINLNTVDFIPNFDGNEIEPTVLPAKLPILLLNGCAGIAVGMATNVPPHNLSELMDACIALTSSREEKVPKVSDAKLFQLVPAPDFPTAAKIIGMEASKKLYSTGSGGITLRAVTHFEDIKISKTTKTTRSAIVVTELPYQVNKAALLEKIADLVNDKKIDGIADLRDESDRDGIRVVIELKRDAVAAVVLNNLFKKTPLETTFSGNFLALMGSGTVPKRFTLRSALDSFLDFRFETIRRKSAFQLEKVSSRAHIVEGLLKSLACVDEVLEAIRAAPDQTSARLALMDSENPKLNLSKEQADAVLKLQLGQLTRLNKSKLEEERDTLMESKKNLEILMNNDTAVRNVMKDEFKYMKAKFGTPRKTKIETEGIELTDEDLVENTRSVIMVTRSGYIKRMPLQTFEILGRGTRGKRGTSSNSVDAEVAHCFTCNDHDTLLMTTRRGVAYGIRAFQIPTGSRTAKGVPIPSVLPLKVDDVVTSILPVTQFSEDEYCVLATEKGWIKKTSLKAFENLQARGLVIASLEAGDSLKWCQKCTDEDDILIGSTLGKATRIHAEEIRPTGRTSRGVKSMNLKDGDTLAGVNVLQRGEEGSGQYVLVMTANGFGKRIPTEEFRAQARGGAGVIAIKFKSSTVQDRVSCMQIVNQDDEILVITAQGIIVRQKVNGIASQSRTATGVTVQKVNVDMGDHISSVSIVPQYEGQDE
jgi:DNA gyrase subunit A